MQLLASKLLLAFLIAVVIWLNAPLIWGLFQYVAPGHGPGIHELAMVYCNIVVTGLTFFCVAWFLSAFVNSPTFAVFGGLITPLLILLGFQFVSWLVRLLTGRWANDDGTIVQFWYLSYLRDARPVVFRGRHVALSAAGGTVKERRDPREIANSSTHRYRERDCSRTMLREKRAGRKGCTGHRRTTAACRWCGRRRISPLPGKSFRPVFTAIGTRTTRLRAAGQPRLEAGPAPTASIARGEFGSASAFNEAGTTTRPSFMGNDRGP